jgi:hypothetical protein
MASHVLILSRDSEVRTRLSDTIRGLGWETLDFADGASAFLYACGRVASLEAALIDEAIGTQESATLMRRLRLLRPDLRTLVFRRRPSEARSGGAPDSRAGSTATGVEPLEVEVRRARPCRPSDHGEGARRAG